MGKQKILVSELQIRGSKGQFNFDVLKISIEVEGVKYTVIPIHTDRKPLFCNSTYFSKIKDGI